MDRVGDSNLQWRRQTQEVGGQRLGGLWGGVPQRGPGAEPRWGSGGEAPRSRPLYTIYSCEKSLFSLQFTEFDQSGHGSLSRVS